MNMKLDQSIANNSKPTRKRGRPSKDLRLAGASNAVLTREQILDKATLLAKTEPLDDISMVGLARELHVAPALIHYYVGTRDDLISGVANRYKKVLLERSHPLTGDWAADLKQEAKTAFKTNVEYGGVLRYMMSHNRFRLFQQVSEGETDHGVLYLERLASIFRSGGFSPQQAAIACHLYLQFVLTSAYAEVSRQLPRFHQDYILSEFAAHPQTALPNARYFLRQFASLDTDTAFPAGLRLLIDGFQKWLPTKVPIAGKPRKVPISTNRKK